MSKTKLLICAGSSLMVLILIGASFFIGDQYAVEHLSITQATPDQLANAMAQDHFYSDYRESTLLIVGKVASVDSSGGEIVITFQTSTTYKAFCSFSNQSPTIHSGDTVKLLSEGALAERLPSAVMLNHCMMA